MVFHLAIIIGIVFFDFAPVDFLWGGRLQTAEELLTFEFISLMIITFCFLIIVITSGRLPVSKMAGVVKVLLWVLFLLFLLNTIGNLLAKTNFEKGFAVVTAFLAFLCLRLALGKEGSKET